MKLGYFLRVAKEKKVLRNLKVMIVKDIVVHAGAINGFVKDASLAFSLKSATNQFFVSFNIANSNILPRIVFPFIGFVKLLVNAFIINIDLKCTLKHMPIWIYIFNLAICQLVFSSVFWY